MDQLDSPLSPDASASNTLPLDQDPRFLALISERGHELQAFFKGQAAATDALPPEPEFTSVKKRKANTPPNTRPTSPVSIIDNNPFDVLPTDNDVEEESTEAPPDLNIPPIFIRDTKNWLEKRKLINSVCAFQPVASLRRNDIMIKCQKVDDFRATTKILGEHKIPHFSYQLKEDKKQHFVIKGLPTDSTPESISSELAAKGINTEHIHQLKSSRPTPEENRHRTHLRQNDPEAQLPSIPLRPLPMFQIRLDHPEEKGTLNKIKRVLGLEADVVPYNPTPGPIQCRRCQDFGHTHKTCGLELKCMKCAGPHHHTACTKKRDIPGKCANCQGAHVSIYKGCPKYKEIAYQMRLKAAPTKVITEPPPMNDAHFPAPPPLHNAWAARQNKNRRQTNGLPPPPTPTPPTLSSTNIHPTLPSPSFTPSLSSSNPQPKLTNPINPAISNQPLSSAQSQPTITTPTSTATTESWKTHLKAWLSGLIRKIINPTDGKSRMDILIEEVITGAMLLLNGL